VGREPQADSPRVQATAKASKTRRRDESSASWIDFMISALGGSLVFGIFLARPPGGPRIGERS
jgi:hypothetical protein